MDRRDAEIRRAELYKPPEGTIPTLLGGASR